MDDIETDTELLIGFLDSDMEEEDEEEEEEEETLRDEDENGNDAKHIVEMGTDSQLLCRICIHKHERSEHTYVISFFVCVCVCVCM